MYQGGGGYLDDHVSIPETLDAMGFIVQNSDPVPSFLRFNVLYFAFGNVLGQKVIHELQGVRYLLLGPWYTLRDTVYASSNYCLPVQQEHRDFRPQGRYVCNAESYKALSVPTRPKTWV